MLAGAGGVLISSAWGFLDGRVVPASWPHFVVVFTAGAACVVAGLRGGAGSGLPIVATIAGLHAGLPMVLEPVMARHHVIPGGAAITAAVLNLAGMAATAGPEGALLLESSGGPAAVAITWETAAFPALVRCGVALALLGGVSGLPRVAGGVLGWGFLRTIAMAAARAEGAFEPWMREPALTLLTLLPLALLAGRDGTRPGSPDPRRARLSALMILLALLAGAGIGFWREFRAPGGPAGGRVLIDESHSDWEPTDGPFDPEHFGQRSLYNYALWARWIGAHYRLRVTRETPDDRALARADVVIINTPTRPYAGEEIDRLERFVREGGGLLLIGDHTNLFGMTTVLNGVAAPYGIEFRSDDTFPLDHESEDILVPPRRRHPVLRGIDAYPFETSCSLKASWRADPVMIGRRLGAEPADYGHVNFFGNIRLDPSEPFGLFIQAAVTDHGKGRVAVFSDSTNFSNFSMLWPGRRALTLNMIDWLNRRPPGFPETITRWGLLGAGIVSLAGLVRLVTSLGGWGGLRGAAIVWSLLAGLGSGGWIATVGGARCAGDIEPMRPLRRAIFDRSLSGFELAASSPAFDRSAPSWASYNSFFIDTARLGLWPEPAEAPVEVGDAAVWVVINPRGEVSSDLPATIAAFLRNGGRFLVVDSSLNSGSTAGAILEPFGMTARVTLGSAPEGGAVVPRIEAVPSGQWRENRHAAGLTSWSLEVGAGRMMYVHDGALLSDRGFGGVYVTPDADQHLRHRAHMELMNILMEGA